MKVDTSAFETWRTGLWWDYSEDGEMSKPKRTLAEIRENKKRLASEIEEQLMKLHEAALMTPHNLVRNGKMQDVEEYKKHQAKCVEYRVNSNGSTNQLISKLEKVKAMKEKILGYI